MKFFKLLFLALAWYLILNPKFNRSYADISTNSIIRMFCVENVKSEMLKANLKYEESFGKEVCNCYLNKISNNISHEDSISECKIESKNNINLQ